MIVKFKEFISGLVNPTIDLDDQDTASWQKNAVIWFVRHQTKRYLLLAIFSLILSIPGLILPEGTD